jgi:polyphosphate glucokinase
MEILGIDIGGSGIKGAPVDIEKGVLSTERYRIPTPQPALTDSVAKAVGKIVKHYNWAGPVGCTFPGVVKNGIAYFAGNIDRSWFGTNVETLLEQRINCPVKVLNDADAAGMAEMAFGAGKGKAGVVIMLTFGTGIGSAVFVDGNFMPNTELGQLVIRGKRAEVRASDHARTEKNLTWKKWAKRVNEYLSRLEFLLSPDLIIIGGGVCKCADRFIPLLQLKAKVIPAQLQNDAGIVGAALAAQSLAHKTSPQP